MKIALAQMRMSQDMESNYLKSLDFIRNAAEKGASLVMFPETQLTPFFPQYADKDVSDYAMTLEHPGGMTGQKWCIVQLEDVLITFDPLWKTLDEIKGFRSIPGLKTTISAPARWMRFAKTKTLNDICNMLHCDISDVISFRPDGRIKGS